MASNDSNEPGNAAAAQTAFQVGDRVRCIENPVHEFGVVVEPDEPGYVLVEMAANSLAPGARLHYRPDQLIIISRATPAPAPAQTVDIDAATAEFESWNPWGNKRPVVVCLCGSTRFSKAFREANLRETLEGRIVLSIGCDMRSDTEIFGEMTPDELADIKRRLDDLHKRKIDIADEILVLNLGGYIGESTASEIAYAKAHGKTIRYLETTGGLPTQPGETPDMAESTATEPATPAPAGYSSDDALYECPNLDCEMVAVTPLVRTSDGALCCPECKTELVQPATPAPAATAPALDTHTLALDFREDCSRCCGERGNGECPECDGDGFNIRTLRLSDEAVDRLAAALVKRMARDIRMIANDRP